MKKLNITKMKINKKVLSLFLFFVALYFRVRDRCVDWAQSIETVQAVFRRLPTWCRAVVYAVCSLFFSEPNRSGMGGVYLLSL